jgi:hypothetical protein
VLAPWWEAFGPWSDCGSLIAPSLVWRHALFTTGDRDPDAKKPRMDLDPARGTCIAAQSHLGAGALVIEARHQLATTDIKRPGSLLALASPTLAFAKGLASDVRTRVDLAEVRAFVPLSAISSIEAVRRFSTTRPLVGPARRQFDQFGHGPLDTARVTLRLYDGWRRHSVTLATDGQTTRWPYEATAFEQWVMALAGAVGRARPTVVDDTPSRWSRSFDCDGARPLSVQAERVPAREGYSPAGG